MLVDFSHQMGLDEVRTLWIINRHPALAWFLVKSTALGRYVTSVFVFPLFNHIVFQKHFMSGIN